MRIAFMGSGRLACPALRALLEQKQDEVVGLVTQPDRPSGRRQHLTPCPVRAFVGQRDIPILMPEKVSAPDVVEQIASWKPDLFVVADFGQLLKPALLAVPPLGSINIHPSLLPKYRGAAPIAWAVANGDTETGLTIMYLNERMDAGDIILQEQIPIHDEHTAATLEPLMAELGATLLLRALMDIRAGRIRRTPQDESRVVLAPKLRKQDGRIIWTRAAAEIHNRVRGFVPWPGTYCEVPEGAGHFLRIMRTKVEEGRGRPGEVLGSDVMGPLVACGEKAIRLLEVQPEGKKPMAGGAYLCGHPMKAGELLG